MHTSAKYTGLRTGIKHAFVEAFRKGLTDGFWGTIDESMNDVRPEDHVLPEFPVRKQEFPIVRLDVSLNTVNWTSMQRYRYDEAGKPKQTGMCTPNVTVYVYALSALQRDRIMDAYTNMLLFSYVHPESTAFSNTLEQWPGMGIQPHLDKLSFGQDNAGTGIPWAQDQYIYMSTLSFDATVVFYMQPTDESIALIEEVDVEAKL